MNILRVFINKIYYEKGRDHKGTVGSLKGTTYSQETPPTEKTKNQE
jgi:hypothetical protein